MSSRLKNLWGLLSPPMHILQTFYDVSKKHYYEFITLTTFAQLMILIFFNSSDKQDRK